MRGSLALVMLRASAAVWLLAYIDGVISDPLARPQIDFDPHSAIAPAVHGILVSDHQRVRLP